MKITRKYLNQIISEEFNRLSEEEVDEGWLKNAAIGAGAALAGMMPSKAHAEPTGSLDMKPSISIPKVSQYDFQGTVRHEGEGKIYHYNRQRDKTILYDSVTGKMVREAGDQDLGQHRTLRADGAKPSKQFRTPQES